MKNSKLILKPLIFPATMLLLVFSSQQLYCQSATEVMKKMDKAMYAAQDQKIEMEMQLIDKNGNKTTRKAITWQKGSDMRLFKFTYPEAYNGIALLSLPNEVMYVYLPAYNKERRIASQSKNSSFQGTDFTYENMDTKAWSDKYEAVSVTESRDYFILTSKPKAGVKTPYSKLVTKVIKASYYPKEVIFYDKKGTKSKILDNTKIEKIKDYWIATDFTMTTIKTGHHTRMIYKNIEFDTGLNDDIFTIRNLKK